MCLKKQTFRLSVYLLCNKLQSFFYYFYSTGAFRPMWPFGPAGPPRPNQRTCSGGNHGRGSSGTAGVHVDDQLGFLDQHRSR